MSWQGRKQLPRQFQRFRRPEATSIQRRPPGDHCNQSSTEAIPPSIGDSDANGHALKGRIEEALVLCSDSRPNYRRARFYNNIHHIRMWNQDT
ncbi:MAG: hypothetical protein OXC80_04065 [Gammaproteobacteria bacterium]|nr:hypothetical protein [Gammaproteobacteria bacterium]